jgi:predicted ATPase
MSLTEIERELLRDVLAHVRAQGEFPRAELIRRRYKPQGGKLEDLGERGFLCVEATRCQLTLKGLRACGTDVAAREIEACEALLPILESLRKTKGHVSAPEVADIAKTDAISVARSLSFLSELHAIATTYFSPITGLAEAMDFSSFGDGVPASLAPPPEPAQKAPKAARDSDPRLEVIEVSGYRSFRGFRAEMRDLSVIIGASSSGKTNLFDFLRFISFAAGNPLPPEIDPGNEGRTLFHAGGPEKISFHLEISLGRRLPVEYHADIHGPMGAPKVTREIVTSSDARSVSNREPFLFLHRLGGSTTVANRVERTSSRAEWNFPLNELALRRMLDPTLFTLSKLRDYIASWRFYSGFDVSMGSKTRRPSLIEPTPALDPTGNNLNAVLAWLMSDHPDAWEELDARLRVAIPSYRGLTMRTRSGEATVMGMWREAGLAEDLTLADLSAGTLRFLCWATLCVSPALPPLMCIDAPEHDLHPRAITVLADMLRHAAARSQIVVTTQSPHFLSRFTMKDVAVIRKEDGRSVFVRPSEDDSILADVNRPEGEELSRMHISGELESPDNTIEPLYE